MASTKYVGAAIVVQCCRRRRSICSERSSTMTMPGAHAVVVKCTFATSAPCRARKNTQNAEAWSSSSSSSSSSARASPPPPGDADLAHRLDHVEHVHAGHTCIPGGVEAKRFPNFSPSSPKRRKCHHLNLNCPPELTQTKNIDDWSSADSDAIEWTLKAGLLRTLEAADDELHDRGSSLVVQVLSVAPMEGDETGKKRVLQVTDGECSVEARLAFSP